MRYVGIVLVLLSLPVFIALLRGNPRQRKWAYFAIGFLPFGVTIINADAALISWPAWTGYSKGMVLSLLDTLAIAVIAIARSPLRGLPFLGLMIAYFLAVALSMAFSDLWMSSSFYAFQVMRVLLVFVAVASFAGDPRAVRWLAWGLAAGAIWEAAVTIDQRLSGVVQAVGTMGHQNLLGLMLHFVTLPLLALLLAGERSKIVMAGTLAALVAVSLGASRGTLLFVGIGVALLLMLSLTRRATPHKWKIVGLVAVAAALVIPLSINSLGDRFGSNKIYNGPDGEREAFNRAATAMWTDHPMGVGANQYVVTANSRGYNERAGVFWNYSSRSAKVHNMYLLAAAETGWFGLLSLAGLFAWAMIRGFSFVFQRPRDARGDIVLGATVAILVTALHGFSEWVFFTVNAQYVFAISLGIVAGSIRQGKAQGAKRVVGPPLKLLGVTPALWGPAFRKRSS